MFSLNSSQSQVQAGPDLTEVQTEGIGFQSLAGEIRLKLLPNPWPSNALPKPTSTLLSIAPRNELLAAAGPDILVIATTSTVREAFTKDGPIENNTKSFTPQLQISIPRVSHVAFSSDENYLIICADEGGGLSVYDVQELKKGNTRSSFELGTNSTAVRALVPNPAPENGHVTAIVLQNGQLLLVNLRDRQLVSGKQGMVLKEGVSCISWSNKGKQLVAGLGNGTVVQMDPEGDVKADIPRPSGLSGDLHVSGVSWLNNDLFFIIYTPTFSEHEGVPDSVYMLVTRQPRTTNYTFQKMQDPVGTFGMNRSPPHHFIQRLRDFPPNLSDVILLSSTASGDIGMITSSTTPLSSDPSAVNTANVYTSTGIANDARRAQLPVNEQQDAMSDESMDTSPIGMVIDLSSKDNVKRPIPSEEIEITTTPLPALMILNNQGILSTWWFVYSAAVRQGIAYPGLVAASGGQAPTQAQTQPQASPFGVTSQNQPQSSIFATSISGPQQSSPFGALSQTVPFGTPTAANNSSLAKPVNSAFGALTGVGNSLSTSQTPSFSTFGSTSQAGVKPSAWSSGTTGAQFGKSTFGSSTQLGTGRAEFGSAGGLGEKKSVWGTAGNPSGSAATTEKPMNPFSSASGPAPFGSVGTQQNTTSDKSVSMFGGSSAASASPFSLLGQQQSKSAFAAPSSGASTQPATFGSPFGAPSSLSQHKPFGDMFKSSANRVQSPLAKESFGVDTSSDADMDSGTMEEDSANRTSKPLSSSNKTGSSAFQLGSTFKGAENAKIDAHKQSPVSGNPFFGSAFGDALGDAKEGPVTPIKEEPKSLDDAGQQSATPAQPVKLQPYRTEVLPKPTLPELPVQKEEAQKPAKLEEPPLPPSPTPQKSQAEAEEISPPSVPQARETFIDEAPSPAGSPPVDLGDVSSSALSSAESEHEEDDGVDTEEAPLPPDFVSKPTPQPSWNFPPITATKEATSAVEKQKLALPSNSPVRQATDQKSTSGTSLLNPPVVFPPLSTLQDSPRSPSPVRDTRPIAGQRSLTTPTAVAQLASTTPLGPPPTNLLPRPLLRSSLFPSSSKPPVPAQDDRHVFTELSEIPVDNSDELVREELSQPIEPTTKLGPFLAHQDYVGNVGGDGVAAQAERLLRDINSMIDTLGLNARSLSSFIEGHCELYPEEGREREDLEEDDWCLEEIEDLGVIQRNLGTQIDRERPRNVKEKLSNIRSIQVDLAKLRSRNHDMQKTLRGLSSSKGMESSTRPEPLSNEQSVILSDLRKDFAVFQKQLVAAEDAVTLFRTRLAALQSYENDGSGSNNVPTVEAVFSTVAKMTRMIEQKSGDVDLLEAQMRKLKFRVKLNKAVGPSNLEEALGRLSIGSGGGRGNSPFATPPNSKTKISKPGMYQFSYSSDSSDDEPSFEQHSAPRSLDQKQGTQDIGKSWAVSEKDIKAYATRRRKRQQFLSLLKEKVVERSTPKTG